MRMHENRYIDLLLKLIYLVLIGAGCYFFFKYCFKWVVPLIVAYFLSRIIMRPVDFLHKHLKLPRKPATILCTLLAMFLLGAGVYFLISWVVAEGTLLVRDLPQYLESFSEKFAQASQSINALLERFHLDFFDPALISLEGLISQIKLPSIQLTKVVSTVGSAASSVPTILITLVFTVLSTYFLCSENKRIGEFLSYQMGEEASNLLRKLRSFLYNSVGKWVKAQCILICITSFELSIGFLIMRLPYAGLLAMLIALIDALPILGVGTVLLPWALVSLLTGDITRAVTLLIIYFVVLMVRNMIEPRIVGGQLGLDPFVTLICIYFGFRLAGFAGMFLVPVVVLACIKLKEWGYLNIGRGPRPPAA